MSPYPPGITYRELTVTDYEDLKELGRNCLPVPYPESYWLSIAGDKNAHYSLGAYTPEGRLIGAIGVIRSVKDFFALKFLHQDEQELVNLFKKIYLHVLHSNLPAIRLYEKMGYKKVVEIPNYYKIDGKQETGIIYCRRLAVPICHGCLTTVSCSIL